MQPIVGELIIERMNIERKGLFRRRPSDVSRWVAHRNIWNLSEDNFPVKYLVTDQDNPTEEYRDHDSIVMNKACALNWLLSEEPVLASADTFEEMIRTAQEADVHDVIAFQGDVWLPVSHPVYEIIETDEEVLVSLTDSNSQNEPLFEAGEQQEALAYAAKVADKCGKRSVRQTASIVDVQSPEPIAPAETVAKATYATPLHPVAELVTVRMPEVIGTEENLMNLIAEPSTTGTDIVAQLSVLATATRRLLDDARTLNNDPNAQ